MLVEIKRGDATKDDTNDTNDDTKNEQKNGQKKLTERQMAILNALQENPSIAQQEMSKRTGIKYSTLRRDMDFLRQEGYITREGGKTYGHWVIIE